MKTIIKRGMPLTLTLLSSFIIMTACQSSVPPPRPIAVALIYDVSKSAEKNGIPALDIDAIDRLFALLKKRGGVLAFCEIDGKTRLQPLHRLQLEVLKGNLEQRALANTRNKAKLSEFRTQIESKLQHRVAGKSDILGALARTVLFFNEPLVAEMDRVLIIISDGQHDAATLARPSLPPEVVVIAIGIPQGLAVALFNGRPVTHFESIEGAIYYLESMPAQTQPSNKGEQ